MSTDQIFSLSRIMALLAAFAASDARADDARSSSAPPAATSESEKPLAIFDQIGSRVFDRALESDTQSNVVMSPSSLDTALGMLSLGADGATAELFRKNGIDPLHGSKRNGAELASLSATGITLRSANSAWLRAGLKPRRQFPNAIRAAYDAGVATLDFSKPDAVEKINAWVNAATEEVIPQVVDRLDPETEFALVNTTYFKGKWAQPFDKADTRTSSFTRVDGTKRDVSMMNAWLTMPYADGGSWHAIAIPYSGDRLQMIVATSKDPANSDALKQELIRNRLSETLGQLPMEKRKVALALPRFKINYGADLTAALSTLGLKEAFGAEANYRKITKHTIRRTSLIHRTVVEVTEEGTEAAAASAVVGVRSISPTPRTTFTADHPFFFAIVDKPTGTVIFEGYVADPES
jgi:serine protease inhibitor